MTLLIRDLRPDEALVFFDIHSRAIRGLAALHYPPEVVASWVGTVNDDTLRAFLRNPDREIRLIAEENGVAVGLGCLVVENSELRACYVVPEAARKGVGSALVREMERIAIAGVGADVFVTVARFPPEPSPHPLPERGEGSAIGAELDAIAGGTRW